MFYFWGVSADAYVLQLQKYEMPPAPAVSQQSSHPTSAKQAMKTSNPSLPSRPSTSPSISPLKPQASVQNPSLTKLQGQLPVKTTPGNMLAPYSVPVSVPKLTTTTATAAAKASEPSSQQVPAPTNISSQSHPTKSPVATVQVSQRAATPTSPAITGPTSQVRKVVPSTMVNTVSSSTPTKSTGPTQAIVQGQPTGVGTQGMTLVRTPMQLPPGVHATMITNAQGVPVMKLEGPGLQGASPIIMNSQVGAAQLQGATIVRVTTPVSVPAMSTVSQSMAARTAVPNTTTTMASSVVKKVPTPTPAVPPKVPTPTPASPKVTTPTPVPKSPSTGTRQPLPVTLPANLPPGTQIKVLSPSGQLTAIGPGGIQTALQSIMSQLPPGMQLQQIKAGTSTVFQAVPILTSAGSKPALPTGTIVQSGAKVSMATAPSSAQGTVTTTPSTVKGPGVTLVSQLGSQLKVVPTVTVAKPSVQSTTSMVSSVPKTMPQATKVLGTTQATTALNIPKTVSTVSSQQISIAAATSTKQPTVISTVQQHAKPLAATTNAIPATILTGVKVATPSTVAKTTGTLLASAQKIITAQTPILATPSSAIGSTMSVPGIIKTSLTMATKPSLVSVVTPPVMPVNRAAKPVSTPVVNALTTPLVSSTIPSASHAVPKISASMATLSKMPVAATTIPKSLVNTPTTSSMAALAARLTSTSQTSPAVSVNGSVTSNPATTKQQILPQQKVSTLSFLFPLRVSLV